MIKRKLNMRRTSERRAAQLREYSKQRALFLEAHPFCQFFIKEHGLNEQSIIEQSGYAGPLGHVPRAVDIHHTNKRHGPKLLDQTYWMAVSREAHLWIHQHHGEARERGYLI